MCTIFMGSSERSYDGYFGKQIIDFRAYMLCRVGYLFRKPITSPHQWNSLPSLWWKHWIFTFIINKKCSVDFLRTKVFSGPFIYAAPGLSDDTMKLSYIQISFAGQCRCIFFLLIFAQTNWSISSIQPESWTHCKLNWTHTNEEFITNICNSIRITRSEC